MRSSDDSGLSDVSEEVLWTSPGAHRFASRLSPSNTARPQPVDGARPASELRTLFPGSHQDTPGSSLESHDIWHPRAPTRVYVSRGLPHDDISPLNSCGEIKGHYQCCRGTNTSLVPQDWPRRAKSMTYHSHHSAGRYQSLLTLVQLDLSCSRSLFVTILDIA